MLLLHCLTKNEELGREASERRTGLFGDGSSQRAADSKNEGRFLGFICIKCKIESGKLCEVNQIPLFNTII